MKKFKKLLLASAMLAVLAVPTALTGCFGADNSPVKIELIEGLKTAYYEGEEIDLSQGMFKYVDENGNESIINLTDCEISGFSTDTQGNKIFTVSYGGATYQVSYNVAKSQESLTIISNPASRYYRTQVFGEDADFAVGAIRYTAPNGEVFTSDITKDMLEGFDTSTIGNNKTATVKYGNKTATFTYSVKEFKQIERDVMYWQNYEDYEDGRGVAFRIGDDTIEVLEWCDSRFDAYEAFYNDGEHADDIDTYTEFTRKINYDSTLDHYIEFININLDYYQDMDQDGVDDLLFAGINFYATPDNKVQYEYYDDTAMRPSVEAGSPIEDVCEDIEAGVVYVFEDEIHYSFPEDEYIVLFMFDENSGKIYSKTFATGEESWTAEEFKTAVAEAPETLDTCEYTKDIVFLGEEIIIDDYNSITSDFNCYVYKFSGPSFCDMLLGYRPVINGLMPPVTKA